VTQNVPTQTRGREPPVGGGGKGIGDPYPHSKKKKKRWTIVWRKFLSNRKEKRKKISLLSKKGFFTLSNGRNFRNKFTPSAKKGENGFFPDPEKLGQGGREPVPGQENPGKSAPPRGGTGDSRFFRCFRTLIQSLQPLRGGRREKNFLGFRTPLARKKGKKRK